MEEENRVRVLYGTEKRGERFEMLEEASALAAAAVCQICNIMYICNKRGHNIIE